MTITPDRISALADEMRKRQERGFRVRPAFAWIVVEALDAYARALAGRALGDDLDIRVEAWSRDGNRVEELLAQTTNAIIGRAAFEAAVTLHAKRLITLRHGIRVIARSRASP